MEITELLEYRDAVRAIIADASIAAADKDKIVAEAIKGLNMTRLSSAPHLRSLIAKELHQQLDNLRTGKTDSGASDLRARPRAGEDARPTERPSDIGTYRDTKGPEAPRKTKQRG